MTSRIGKLLVANRGEIAVRIIRTCRTMGISPVAVYSSADADALHVQLADEAYLIGPPPALESYLDAGAVLRAAVESGADAVHPGYGFLAENAEFARRVEEAGLIWIGPPADVIALMGDKVASKALAASAGVPVVPGYAGDDQSEQRMCDEAELIGFPVMVKATAGGGGKGMRAVQAAADLPAALAGAKREAHSAFGDDRVFLEKLIVEPRHIEIQIFRDHQGEAVYLGERDCSIQRRHQKVIEEAPSPVLTPVLRASMGEDALRLARASKYVNAGTVEFLFSADSYYFLEMNTRIQVEHPVTEMITDLDLVHLQIVLAAGDPLPINQNDVELRGHAMEARIYAEDPAHDFLPSTGVLRVFQPPGGPGVRNDAGVFEGAEVTSYYDPMLAKLIVWGETRDEAAGRLRGALATYGLAGPANNLDFLRWIAGDPAFLAGNVDIGFVGRNWSPPVAGKLPFEELAAAAILQTVTEPDSPAAQRADRYSPWRFTSGWRQNGMTRAFEFEHGGAEQYVQVCATGPSCWRVEADGQAAEFEVVRAALGTLVLRSGSHVLRFDVARRDGALELSRNGVRHQVRSAEAPAMGRARTAQRGDETPTAPMPGTVVKVAVQEGQRVTAHEPLVVLEAMKMEHVVESPRDATVKALLVREGELVPAGAPLVQLEAV